MMASKNSQAISRVVEMQVSGLVGPALDWAVAQVDKPEGFVMRDATADIGCWVVGIAHDAADPESWMKSSYSPSTDWSQGGPLIEKHGLSLLAPEEGFSQWSVIKEWCHGDIESTYPESPTALIAVCRAIVAAHLGEVVSVPAELT